MFPIDKCGEVLNDVYRTLQQKNRDYGSAVFNSPFLCPELPCESACLVRISDKISRLRTLATQEAEVKEESMDDTIKDLIGYLACWYAIRKYENYKQEINQ